MPVGVPKTPFQNPGDEDPSWVDLYNRLYRERLLFLSQPVDTPVANQLISLILYLSIEDKTKDIRLFINSPGGWVVPGVGLYDIMQLVDADVHTIGLGFVASMACYILLGGTITKRLALPNVRIMMHQPASVFADSKSGEFSMDVSELIRLRERITSAYIHRTGKPLWVISADLERDAYMSATDAKEYGIVDEVAADSRGVKG